MSHLHQALKGPALNRDKDGTTLPSLWENLLKTQNREGDRGPLFEIKKGWDQKRNHKSNTYGSKPFIKNLFYSSIVNPRWRTDTLGPNTVIHHNNEVICLVYRMLSSEVFFFNFSKLRQNSKKKKWLPYPGRLRNSADG